MQQIEHREISHDLPAVLDAAAVRDLYGRIEPFIAENTLLTLNAAAVERLGTQAVQLLLATARALDMNGGRLAIVHATPPLRDAYADLGLLTELDARSLRHEAKDTYG